jgi:Domain of unknown function (DUF4333)
MVRVAVAAFVAALAVVGCGETVVDDVKTADTLQRYLERSRGEDVRSVDCPADQPVDPKSTFDCEVVLVGGQQKVITVEISNEDADFGVVDYKPKR